MFTIDPKVMSFLAAFRMLMIAIGAVLADNHLGGTSIYHVIMAVAGGTMAVGSAAWALYATFMSLRKSSAVGVQAGINLMASGQGVDTAGHVISASSASTPPKPVTLTTASQIVNNFGPSPGEVARV